MAIKYALVSTDGTVTDLNDSFLSFLEDGSLTLGAEVFSFTSEIVEKTGLDGSVRLSNPLLQAKDVNINFSIAYSSYTDFRTQTNSILQLIRNVEYLAEREEVESVWTTTRTMKVSPIDISIPYDEGSYQKSANCSLTFSGLDPFWTSATTNQDLNNTVATGSTVTVGTINNSGSLSTPPIIQIVSETACDSVQIWNDTTGEGIEIKDPIFGTTSFTIMEIDCGAGTVTISDIDRTAYITIGTGFFFLETGDNIIKSIVSNDCVISLDWNNRNYL